MESTRWIATWIDASGRERAYYFDAPNHRMLARLDFQLKLADLHEPMPEHFELEEAIPRIRVREQWKEL